MSVVVYRGDNLVATNTQVLQLAAAQPDLQPVLVLVPDRFTLQAERIMLAANSHLLNTRVVTFSMLYQMVASEVNQETTSPNVLDKTTAVLYLWAAIKQVQTDLQWFKKSVTHYDFAEKMFNTLNAIRSSGVDFADLETQAQTTVARKKYHDITLIYQKYREILGSQMDSSGMLEYLQTHLTASKLVAKAHVFICGFESLSPSRLAVVAKLAKVAAAVTIGAATSEFIEQLVEYPWRHLKTPVPRPQITQWRCETPRQEAVTIVEKIVSLLNQGVDPEVITVLLTEFDTLAPVWQVVFDQYHVPVNLDVGQKLSETPEAKYLRDLLELALNDCTENAVAVLFNPTSGVPVEVACELENRMLKNDLRARYVPEIPHLTDLENISGVCQQLLALAEPEKLRQILERIADFVAREPLTLRELENLFWTLCTATKVSNIPLYRERVLVAAVSEWVPSSCQYLFIANCTADNFPQGQPDDDILQEADLVGTKITPTPSLQRIRNHRHARLLLTVPSITLIQSGMDENFTPVPFVSRSQRVIFHDDAPLSTAADLFFPHQKVKITLIERYYSCPHLNFLQNGLRLQPREIYQLKPNTVGTALHKALEIYFQKQSRARHWSTEIAAQALQAAVAAGTQALGYHSKPLVVNLEREIRFIITSLQEYYAQGKFQVAAVEQDIAVPLARDWQLVGRLDRVDVATQPDGTKVYFVLDYKTGTIPTQIAKSIYLGHKLQLPLYADAWAAKGRVAGAGYLALPKGYGDDRKTMALRGFIADDCRDLFAPALVAGDDKQFIPPENLTALRRYANHLVQQAVSALVAGDVRAHAVDETVCQYCPVQATCPHAGKNCRGTGVKVSFATFLEGEHD